MQKSEAFRDAFSKVVSRKAGYKTIIEKKPIIIKCKKCHTVIDGNQKFCHECGEKVEHSSH